MCRARPSCLSLFTLSRRHDDMHQWGNRLKIQSQAHRTLWWSCQKELGAALRAPTRQQHFILYISHKACWGYQPELGSLHLKVAQGFPGCWNKIQAPHTGLLAPLRDHPQGTSLFLAHRALGPPVLSPRKCLWYWAPRKGVQECLLHNCFELHHRNHHILTTTQEEPGARKQSQRQAPSQSPSWLESS